MSDFEFRCQNDADVQCAESCVGLDTCQECQCAIVEIDAGGPWGDVMDVIFCLFPIVFLIVVTIKPNPYPTTRSLPMAALFMWLVRLMYLGSDPLATCAAIVLGLHEAFTPLSIMAGAITLFETMEATYCMPYMMREMKALTVGHPVAELMLIFAFAYMIEGASGFGTPVALGAPMLVSTGHSKLESVVTLLIMNAFSTVWGAVGTPIWFGFGSIFEPDVQDEGFIQISYKAAICLGTCAFVLVPPLLCIICPWDLVKKNLVFIYLSLFVTVGPSLGIAFGSEEFPSLIGGMVGCAGTAFLIKFKIGLSSVEELMMTEDGKDIMEIGSVSEHSLVKKIERTKSIASSTADKSGSGRKIFKHASSNVSDITTEAFSQQLPADNTVTEKEDRPFENGIGLPEINESQEVEIIAGHSNGIKNTDNTENSTAKVTFKSEDDVQFVDLPETFNPSVSQKEELDAVLGPRKEFGEGYIKELIMRTSPIWLVVLLLVLTRVEQIGLKPILTKQEPNFAIFFGTYGTFRLSASLVLQLNNILTYPQLNWKFEFLYLPFIMPFMLVSLFTLLLYRKNLQRTPKEIAATVIDRLTGPAIALLGALSLVQLLLRVDTAAPAYILGTVISDWFKQAFIIISPLLGALGSFFSGSTTVSNLTFGTIQALAAESIGVSKTTMLALQAIGGSAGNGICLNNIIAASAVVGLDVGEGAVLKQTYKYVLAITTISTIIMLAFFFRF